MNFRPVNIQVCIVPLFSFKITLYKCDLRFPRAFFWIFLCTFLNENGIFRKSLNEAIKLKNDKAMSFI